MEDTNSKSELLAVEWQKYFLGKTNCSVALLLSKFFPRICERSKFCRALQKEARQLANLSHPNIVGVFDWGKERNTYYIVMEYVEGRTLSQIIRKEGSLPAAE